MSTKRHHWFPYVVAYFAFLVVVGILVFFSRPAHAASTQPRLRRHGPVMHCYYTTSKDGVIGTQCYREAKECKKQIRLFNDILQSKPLTEKCFISRETAFFTYHMPDGVYREILPNMPTCKDSQAFSKAVGYDSTECRFYRSPAESRGRCPRMNAVRRSI